MQDANAQLSRELDDARAEATARIERSQQFVNMRQVRRDCAESAGSHAMMGAMPLAALEGWKDCTQPDLLSPRLTSPHLASPRLTSPRLASPHLAVADALKEEHRRPPIARPAPGSRYRGGRR